MLFIIKHQPLVSFFQNNFHISYCTQTFFQTHFSQILLLHIGKPDYVVYQKDFSKHLISLPHLTPKLLPNIFSLSLLSSFNPKRTKKRSGVFSNKHLTLFRHIMLHNIIYLFPLYLFEHSSYILKAALPEPQRIHL